MKSFNAIAAITIISVSVLGCGGSEPTKAEKAEKALHDSGVAMHRARVRENRAHQELNGKGCDGYEGGDTSWREETGPELREDANNEQPGAICHLLHYEAMRAQLRAKLQAAE